MNSSRLDPTSLLFLFAGRDSTLTIFILAAYLLYTNRRHFISFLQNPMIFKTKSVTLEGKVITNSHEQSQNAMMPATLKAVFYYMKNSADKAIYTTMKECKLHFVEVSKFTKQKEYMYLPEGTLNNIKITPDIFLTVNIWEEKEGDKENIINIRTFTLTLHTNKSITDIYNFIHSCEKEYEVYVKEEARKLLIIKPFFTSNSSEAKLKQIYSHSLPLTSEKTFDNLFFDGKQDLIRRLDLFKQRDIYNTMGIPHALGLLFHGSPGTGKTSAIKAIAKYMKMNIIIIPMNSIRTRADLEQIFYTQYYGQDRVPYDKRIYVFEEIDCNGWEDIVINRRDKANLSDILSAVQTEDDMKKYMLLKKEEESKINLGAFLELLDGIIEVPGRIVIMTTNHPEKLDPAIKRPGRIDMEIEFKKLRRQHIAEIYEKWCGNPMKESTMNKLPDYYFSQAELAPYLFKFNGNPSGFIDAIMKASHPKK